MNTSAVLTTSIIRGAVGALILALTLFLSQDARGKTPDGMPPSEEEVCGGLTGAAFGLCNAYCEAQDCDVHPRPSCAVLRRNFERLTGSSAFPCDAPFCGDGMVNQRTEECDPPGSPCPDGPCNEDCTCPRVGCCECPGTVPICSDDVSVEDCLARNCLPGPPESTCVPTLGRCVTTTGTFCCACDNGPCFDALSPDACMTAGCVPIPPPSACDPTSGTCMTPVP